MDQSQLTFLGYGVLIGLAVAIWVAIAAWNRRRTIEAELRRLRQHLQDQMEITHEGAQQRKLELERLRQENENLRITLKAWQQKPDRRELRMLHVYDHAVHQLLSNAPGFSPHWENALHQAEQHVAQIDSGLVAFARRLVMPRTGRRREPSDEG
jgi:hypothetical protein